MAELACWRNVPEGTSLSIFCRPEVERFHLGSRPGHKGMPFILENLGMCFLLHIFKQRFFPEIQILNFGRGKGVLVNN